MSNQAMLLMTREQSFCIVVMCCVNSLACLIMQVILFKAAQQNCESCRCALHLKLFQRWRLLFGQFYLIKIAFHIRDDSQFRGQRGQTEIQFQNFIWKLVIFRVGVLLINVNSQTQIEIIINYIIKCIERNVKKSNIQDEINTIKNKCIYKVFLRVLKYVYFPKLLSLEKCGPLGFGKIPKNYWLSIWESSFIGKHKF